MLKPIKWSSFADKDLELLLEYLSLKWSNKIALKFLDKLDRCLHLIEENPNQFQVFSKEFEVRKCVVTKQNSLFYRITNSRIEILRLYDTRQNPDNLKF